MGTAKTGHDFYLYIGEAADGGAEALQLIDQVEDVNVTGLEYALAELKRRKSRWNLKVVTTLSAAITFKLWHKLSPDKFDFLRSAFFEQTPLEVWVLNGPIAEPGTEGLKLICQLSQFPWNQPLEEISNHDCQLDPTYYFDEGEEEEIEPEWIVIESGGGGGGGGGG